MCYSRPVLDWLLRPFRSPLPLPDADRVPAWATALQARLDAQAMAPPAPWVTELQEAVQKLARAQAKQGARFESLESKVEAGFTELRSATKPAPRDDASPKS